MSKCNICGKEIQRFGNNPWPICDEDDVVSVCCDECNADKVIPARIVLTKNELHSPTNRKEVKVGDAITIFWMHDEPNVQDYIIRGGVVESIDSIGQLHGTWGGLAVNPEYDIFAIMKL